MKKVIGIGIIIFLGILFINQNNVSEKPEIEQNIHGRTQVTLERVVDGDTIVVNMNGIRERVRLIGVDAPESTTEHVTVECFGNEASQFLKDLLSFEESLFIEFDEVAGQRDTYGRILAHVFLSNGENVNKTIIEKGYGYEYTYRGQDYTYKSDYKEAQKDAKLGKRGLWENGVCVN